MFAGLSHDITRVSALAARKVDATMVSFEVLKKSKWWPKITAILDQWEQYRYLDSGVFTLIKQAGKNIGAKERERKDSTVDQRVAALKEQMELYTAFLRQHKDEFDFIIEMDVDIIDYGTVSGVEVAQRCRKILSGIVGEKLLPVWHPVAGDTAWREMINQYEYVALGAGNARDRRSRWLCDEAHAAGAKVHRLGMSRADTLAQFPFDTVDSITWLSSVRFGQFGGHRITYREDTRNLYVQRDGSVAQKGINARETAKAIRVLEQLKQMGIDTRELLEEGTAKQGKYEAAIALLQLRQAEAPPIATPMRQEAMF